MVYNTNGKEMNVLQVPSIRHGRKRRRVTSSVVQDGGVVVNVLLCS